MNERFLQQFIIRVHFCSLIGNVTQFLSLLKEKSFQTIIQFAKPLLLSAFYYFFMQTRVFDIRLECSLILVNRFCSYYFFVV